MENDEFKESMEELYKFLRDKVVTMYGDFFSDEEKKSLYSFDTEKNIIIDNSSRKPVEYDRETSNVIISDGFITTEYIERIKLKNDFDFEKLKDKINNGEYNVLTEELIQFSKELNIKERDVVKSLFVQEILRMIIYKNELSIRDEVVAEGAVELFAHVLGAPNGFIVSTPKLNMEVYEVALELKEIFKKDFESYVFSRNIDDMLMKVTDPSLMKKLNRIVTDRTILESTQNLDEVIDSINEMVEEVNQVIIVELAGNKVIKFIDEFQRENLYLVSDIDKFIDVYNKLRLLSKVVTKDELLKSASFYNIGISEYKDKVELAYVSEDTEAIKMKVAPEEGSYIKEAVVKIEEPIDKVDETEFKELDNRFDKDNNSLTEYELNRMKEYISSDKDMETIKIGKKGKKQIIKYGLIIFATIVVGIFVGWLLFKLK